MDETVQIFSISALTRKIKGVLTTEIGQVWVEGEISNLKQYSSGHTYFVLKDQTAQLNAVLFANARSALVHTDFLKDGQRVRAAGMISVFETRGQYQLVVRTIESAGIGALMELYEALKKKLRDEGLFENIHKKPLPLLPQRIGVVTSPTGAVIHDMLNVLERRFPNMQVLLLPVKVQGEGAAESIARAIEWLNLNCAPGSPRAVDVMIVGRGGGSLEDLWAFNEEIVARAVFASRIPVISAVGHEVDFTLTDFVADLRAPTPSAAAELVVLPKSEFEGRIAQRSADLRRLLLQQHKLLAQRLAQLTSAAVLKRPEQVVEKYAQKVDYLEMRLQHAVVQRTAAARLRAEQLFSRMGLVRERRVAELRARLAGGRQRMGMGAATLLAHSKGRVETLRRQLMLLGPLKVLERGYSLTRGADGALIRSVDDVAPGAAVLTQVVDGVIHSKVDKNCERSAGDE
ncbi:MAG: exodeoxyribonuclease VII large subunit [Kiritimatiellae bacterium]|nr:exodeoxyribonuclease VII large subunit [Kiritimatiellia bacterium]